MITKLFFVSIVSVAALACKPMNQQTTPKAGTSKKKLNLSKAPPRPFLLAAQLKAAGAPVGKPSAFGLAGAAAPAQMVPAVGGGYYQYVSPQFGYQYYDVNKKPTSQFATFGADYKSVSFRTGTYDSQYAANNPKDPNAAIKAWTMQNVNYKLDRIGEGHWLGESARGNTVTYRASTTDPSYNKGYATLSSYPEYARTYLQPDSPEYNSMMKQPDGVVYIAGADPASAKGLNVSYRATKTGQFQGGTNEAFLSSASNPAVAIPYYDNGVTNRSAVSTGQAPAYDDPAAWQAFSGSADAVGSTGYQETSQDYYSEQTADDDQYKDPFDPSMWQ